MRIKELRTDLNLTQIELAKAINTSQRNIGRWENGENEPTSSFLVALANYFGVSIDYLMGLEDEASLSFSPKERLLGVVDNAPIAISAKDRELIHLFDEAEEKLGKAYVQGVKQMVKLAIAAKK